MMAAAIMARSNFNKEQTLMIKCCNPNCKKHIICRFIRKGKKIIYPKHSQFFSFCIEDKEKAARPAKVSD